MKATPCDICNGTMNIQSKSEQQVRFACTSCRQTWGIDSNGSAGCTILKMLWPSSMDENSKMYREQFLPAWLNERRHYAAMMSAAEFWNETKADTFIQECQSVYNKWFTEHPKPKPWFIRLWEKVA